MIYSPNNPTTHDLHDAYSIDNNDSLAIAETRIDISNAIAHPANTFLLTGPCALTYDPNTLTAENDEWQAYAEANGGVVVVRRHPFKPRSVTSWGEKMLKWHGLETGYPDGNGSPAHAALAAYELMHDEAMEYHNISMEMAFAQHVNRYGPILSFAQIGARTRNQYYGNYVAYLRFLDYLAKREPTLPIGIKNDTDGTIDQALYEVGRVNEIRSKLGISAVSRAVLIYRGGDNAKTPETWMAGAKNAIVQTRGAVILDAAHGGEQAFDLEGKYEKSEVGQLMCIAAAQLLRAEGLTCVGVAAESSRLESPMDPAADPDAVRKVLQGASVDEVLAAV